MVLVGYLSSVAVAGSYVGWKGLLSERVVSARELVDSGRLVESCVVFWPAPRDGR